MSAVGGIVRPQASQTCCDKFTLVLNILPSIIRKLDLYTFSIFGRISSSVETNRTVQKLSVRGVKKELCNFICHC